MWVPATLWWVCTGAEAGVIILKSHPGTYFQSLAEPVKAFPASIGHVCICVQAQMHRNSFTLEKTICKLDQEMDVFAPVM